MSGRDLRATALVTASSGIPGCNVFDPNGDTSAVNATWYALTPQLMARGAQEMHLGRFVPGHDMTRTHNCSLRLGTQRSYASVDCQTGGWPLAHS